LGTADPTTAIALAIDAVELARLEVAAADDIAVQVALAWHLRQRDTARALALADAAEAALPAAALTLRARLRLVRAEAAWLRAELAAAAELSLQARAVMQLAGDLAGVADATILQAMVAYERGERFAGLRFLDEARAQAAEGGDATRAEAAQAMRAFLSGFTDIDEAERQWGGSMAALQTSSENVLAMWAWDFCAQVEYRRGRYVEAIAGRHKTYHHAVAAGQKRRAIFACLNMGAHYLDLHDNHAALRWIEQGMELARPTGWPGVKGGGLMLLGRVLCELDRLAPAKEALREAARLVLPLAGSTTGRLAVYHASRLASRIGDHESAARDLSQLVMRCESDGHRDMALKGRLELALPLAHLGRHAEALGMAEEALRMAQADGSVVAAIDALEVMAEVHGVIARDAPSAEAGGGPTPRMNCLLRVVELAASVPNFITPAATWDVLAAGYAGLGDHARAYAMAAQAGLAREQVHKQETSHRAQALAAQLEIERNEVERERLREQAALSAERAALLQSTHATLEQLGRIGQEITAQLDVDTVFDRIYAHLQSLVDAPHLSIWWVEEATNMLHMRFGIEAGQKLPPASVAMQSESSNLVRCLREDRELEHRSQGPVQHAGHKPRPSRPPTGFFSPLRVRGRTVGAMCILSWRNRAYGERERLVFRTLCAYGAVALDNAVVYADLSRARAHLQDASEAERQARHQAQRATTLKNEFLVHISGALRKPLGALHESLLKLPQTNAVTDGLRHRQCLEAALEQCDQVNTLARELLDLARLQSGAVQMVREPFSMADLTQDVLHKFEPVAAARGQRLSWRFAPGLSDVVADIAMIERALSELLHATIQRLPARAKLQVRLAPVGDALQVAIVGTAAGVRADQHPHWPGRPTTDDGHLGLAIARQMLLLHGSRVEERTLGGMGARLEFSLSTVPA
jgi:signal transduction histidine kinase